MSRAPATVRRFRWRLLLVAPPLLLIAMSTGWVPFYVAFVADVGLLTFAFGRRRALRR